MSNPLSADLVPQIIRADSSIVLVKILGAKLQHLQDADLPVEAGNITFQVLEVFRSPSLTTASTFEVPARRVADPITRMKNGFDEWNNLNLEPGSLLLLACEPLKPPTLWKGLAARPVETAASPDVAALRRCIAIERFAGASERKAEMLAQALSGGEDLPRTYAIEVLAGGKIFPRLQAARLIFAAIESPATTAPHRLELGASLTRIAFFTQNDKAEGTNPVVVAALAQGLVTENDIAMRLTWARYLGSCVLGRFSDDPAGDRSARLALVRKVQLPAPAKVTAALTELLSHGSPDEREIVRGLLAAWQDATR